MAGPFTVRAKILMRQKWANNPKLIWDDPFPEQYQQNWITFFQDLLEMGKVLFKRCMKRDDAIDDPVLIIFSDAYGACAYVKWECTDGRFETQLILLKNRLAPLKKISIDRIQLCGAVLMSNSRHS